MAIDVGKEGRYDLGFADASGNFIGLMLVKDKNGVPRYSEVNDPGLASQFFTGQVQEVNLEPQKLIKFGQGDHRSGFGQEYYDTSDPKRYYVGKNIDARFKDTVIPGPLATAATIPSVLAITDAGLEAWTGDDLDSWTYSETVGAFAMTKESTEVDAGTYSAKMTLTNAAGHCQILQAAVTWTTAFQNKTFSVSIRVYNDNIARVKGQLIIDDGQSPVTVNSTGSDAWETVTATIKCASDATKLEVICRALHVDIGGVTYFDNVSFPTLGAHGSHFAEFDDDLLFSSNCYLLRMNNSTGAITVQAGFPKTISGLTAHVDGNLYIFQSSTAGQFYYYMSTAEAVTISDSVKDFATVVGANMKAVDLPYTVYSAADPTADANWDSGTTLGFSTDDITSIIELGGLPYCGKEDMPYYIDSSGNEQRLATFLRAERSSTSGTNMIEWQGKIYIPCGTQALFEYDGGTLTDISPSKYITNSTDFDGRIQALAADAQYLFPILESVTTLHEFYNKDYSAGENCRGTLWLSQRFTTESGYLATSIKLKMYRVGSPGTVTASIRAVDGSNDPTGGDLTSGTTDGDTLTTDTDGEWREITLTSYELTLGTSYAIVVRATSGNASNTIKWLVDETEATYAGGAENSSSDSGSSWDGEATDDLADMMFEVYGSSAQVLAGRWETIDGTTSWVWHTLAELPIAGCANAFASTIYKRRAWIASSDSSDSLYYYPLTSQYGNITKDSNYTFQTGGNIVTPYHHLNLKSDPKAFPALTLTVSETTTNIYYEAHYEKLGDIAWTDIGDFKTSPTTTKQIPVDGGTSKPESTMIRFKFVPITNDTSTVPKLLNYSCDAIWYPYQMVFILAQAIVADNQVFLGGGKDEDQSAASIRTALDAWKNPTTAWPRAFYPPYWETSSDTVYAKLMPTTGANFCQLVKDEKDKEKEWVYNLVVMVVKNLTF